MTMLFYMYYVAKEWAERAWDRIIEVLARASEPVAYTQGRVAMPVTHKDADEGYAEELKLAREKLSDTGEIWLVDGAIEVHDALIDLERTTLDEFNEKLDAILAGFQYDKNIPYDTNPMAPAARADLIPWREEIADQFRSVADQVQQDCREEVLTW
jgi:hypothetical protein